MTRILSLSLLIVLAAGSARADVTVRRSARTRGHVDIVATRAPLAEVARALEPYLGRPVTVDAGRERRVTYAANDIVPASALAGVAAAAHIVVDNSHGLVLREAVEPAVTIDVKDADIRTILKTVQRQCGMRNLIIDPDVAGSGTFLFNRVPCALALDTILTTMGLGRYSESSAVTAVGPRLAYPGQ
jgi:type II secretory pathway component GspD/PulD (secretin)